MLAVDDTTTESAFFILNLEKRSLWIKNRKKQRMSKKNNKTHRTLGSRNAKNTIGATCRVLQVLAVNHDLLVLFIYVYFNSWQRKLKLIQK